MSDITSSVDEIVGAVKMILDKVNENDRALLAAVEALSEVVIKLRVRVELLEDLHRLQENLNESTPVN